MSFTLEGINLVKQRARAETRSPAASLALKALFMHLAQNRANPDLKIAVLSGLETADVVVADAPCKLYCVYGIKPTLSTVDSWLKGSDHVSAAAANGDFVAKYVGTGGGAQQHAVTYLDGLKMAAGFTMGAHTTVNGSGKSLVADAPTGFAIAGAP